MSEANQALSTAKLDAEAGEKDAEVSKVKAVRYKEALDRFQTDYAKLKGDRDDLRLDIVKLKGEKYNLK